MTEISAAADTAITVLFFGLYREVGGARRIEMSVVPGSRVSDLLGSLERQLGPLGPPPAVAVNRVHVGLDHVLAAEDEVALLPPVAGG